MSTHGLVGLYGLEPYQDFQLESPHERELARHSLRPNPTNGRQRGENLRKNHRKDDRRAQAPPRRRRRDHYSESHQPFNYGWNNQQNLRSYSYDESYPYNYEQRYCTPRRNDRFELGHRTSHEPAYYEDIRAHHGRHDPSYNIAYQYYYKQMPCGKWVAAPQTHHFCGKCLQAMLRHWWHG
ncbi:hypothetical protein CYLTODRAFT_492592 [Cylindrobasidium torrendii FP15055 ss-10]|uniref:Uncharacterized protein n=1 Tax=Cylindrobasidium torrendii FP15055 ss-10 TaxID=1314674 RepID=A0A0D7B4I1_9AGAR|nr:hypothetical protein CYLTODRAFT_492592 [Cylindrobasidium torrendii FP15055 ss-10]